MANKKFSEFELKTTTSDVSHIVGYNGAENVQITPANFLDTTGGPYLPLVGGTMVGNITVIDNKKIIFGTSPGDDLQIYHDGSNSYINDAGTGGLNIQGSRIQLQNSNGEGYIDCTGDKVEIKFNNLKKFETTTSGISVTGQGDFSGNVKAGSFKAISSIPSETSPSTAYLDFISGNARIISKGPDGTTLGGFQILQQASDSSPASTSFSIDTSSNATFAGSTSLTGNSAIFLDNENNNNPVYLRNSGGNLATLQIGRGNSPGSNISMVIDNAGNLGLGTANPDAKLHILNTGSSNNAIFENSGQTFSYTAIKVAEALNNKACLTFVVGDALASSDVISEISGLVTSDGGTLQGAITFKTNLGDNLAERMRLTAAGVLTLGSEGSTVLKTTITENDKVDLNAGDGTNAASSRNLTFSTGNSERMRLTAGGNLGIGVSPSQKLDVAGKIRLTDDLQLDSTSPRIDFDNGSAGSLRFFSQSQNATKLSLSSNGSLDVFGTITAPKIDLGTTSATDPVLRLIDTGVIAYDWTFPTDAAIRLGVSATSNKSLLLQNSGSGEFNLSVDNTVTAASFTSTTDSGININGLTITRIAANSALRVADGFETLGLLRSYAGLNIAGTSTFGNVITAPSGVINGLLKVGGINMLNSIGGSIGFNRNPASGAIGNSSVAAYQMQNLSSVFELQSYTGAGGYTGSFFFNAGKFCVGAESNPDSKLSVKGGDAEVIDSASGLILKSPDNTRYRIKVANGGTLTVTAV